MLDDRIKRKIAQSYRDGGFDSEAMVIMVDYCEDFRPHKWQEWLNDEDFRLFIEDCRILSQAWWERKLREEGLSGDMVLPAWFAAMRGQGIQRYEEKPKVHIDASTTNNTLFSNDVAKLASTIAANAPHMRDMLLVGGMPADDKASA